jgi:hypothetical protein
MSKTAERRMEFLGLLQAILPAVAEMVIQPEPPKPKREHKVISYSFGGILGEGPMTFDVTPPEGEGWTLATLDLPTGLGHWTRVVLIDAEFEEKSETIPSGPPPADEASSSSSAPPAQPCVSCGQSPHASTCPAK